MGGFAYSLATAELFQSMILREAPTLADAAGDFPALSDFGIIDDQATRRYVSEGLKQVDLPAISWPSSAPRHRRSFKH